MTHPTYEANVKLPTHGNKGGVSDWVRNIPANRSLFVSPKDAVPSSVRTIVARISAEFKGKRSFQTAKEGNGIRVWRIT